ncbi:uncharacterized protein LOC126905724 [Daktulosphaira vitifoliae]|uniref:uncharacterized protein LOC126905724 n=1 Tax=Daktulosphaira vitifoliae TaxID=58002 RepID=UPI0021A99C03|nr:uncharacterized protein LOC126905724 [Daktulosphaira vitifoliae]
MMFYYIMTLNVYIFTILLTMVVCKKPLLQMLPPIRHELRIKSLELTFNKTFGKTFIAEFKQFYDVQLLNFNVTIYRKTSPERINVEIIKCKENFIDCSNLRTCDYYHVCDTIKTLLFFGVIGYKNRDIKCPFEGEYIVLNSTFNPNQAFSMLLAPTEKWWENSYKINVNVYDSSDVFIMKLYGTGYFLTFRNKKL